MSRTQELFLKRSSQVLSIYYTAGFPRLESTLPVMKALEEEGADMIELGMPYSDPLADGPVIQDSNSVAIANGMTISALFAQLKGFREKISIPVILMGYMNPVLQYGFDRFCADAAAAGIDGLILPDLPVHEFETTYGPVVKKHGLDFIFMVTPETPDERVKKLDNLSRGFLYAVSSSSTTGQQVSLEKQAPYFNRLKGLGLQNPVLIGFGIKDKTSFEAAGQLANGAIIGSAFVRALQEAPDPVVAARHFVKAVLEG